MTHRVSLVLVSLLFSAQGCVLKGQYDQTVVDQLKCSDALQKAASERDQLKSKYDEAKKQNSDLEVRNEELSTTNQMLAGKNSEFANKCIDARKELVRSQEDRDREEKQKAREKLFIDELAKGLKDEADGGPLSLAMLDAGPSVTIEDRNLFGQGNDQLSAAGKKLIDKVAGILRKFTDRKVSVEGHTDTGPLPGLLKRKYAGNWEYSAGKALKVTRQLELFGVEGRRLSTAGFGEFHPIATNANEAGRKKNRRIDIVFSLIPGAPPPAATTAPAKATP